MLESDSGFVRVAIVVPKWGQTAVRRNLLKRRLRELSRALLFERDASRDIVLRAPREAYDATFADLRTDIERVAGSIS